ncbi:MAG: aminotransferase, partial [Defluviitaleaceae bacterium]|nr:aminotransferase [Defluviitaleaceae bacterium]
KFNSVSQILSDRLAGTGSKWTDPDGGYFVSFDAPDGSAGQIVRLCKEAGLSVTEAGATYPHKKDPRDRNIRLAPSSLSLKDLRTALELFALSVKLATCAGAAP